MAIIPLRSVTVLANNDHCPADTWPLEIISGHKSLPFHFKAPLLLLLLVYGRLLAFTGNARGRGMSHADAKCTGVISLETAAFVRPTPLSGRANGRADGRTDVFLSRARE